MRWLVTGGSGFIGSAFVRRLLGGRGTTAAPGVESVTNLDLLTYAGNPANLSEVEGDPRYLFVQGDIADAGLVESLLRDQRPDLLINFAAESHVDRSIEGAWPFLRTNVLGTQTLLECWRTYGGGRFLQVSSDEVYGTLGDEGRFDERSPIAPSSPYAASKAASDLLVLSAVRTWGLDAVVTRSCNNLGPYQHPEKLIPKMIIRAVRAECLPVYGDGRNVRDWLWVDDHCQALELVALGGHAGRVYNIGASAERSNLEVVRRILRLLGASSELVRLVPDRPGHDWRYALDAGRIRDELGWAPQLGFDEALQRTVAWYVDHPRWWQPLLEER